MSRSKEKAKRDRTDRERLELFLERCDELGQIEPVRTGIGYSHTINYDRTQGTRSTFEEPSDKDMRSVLGELRKFVAQGSDIYLNRIHNIVYRRLKAEPPSEQYKADFRTMNERWKHAFKQGITRLTIKGTLVNPEHAWDAWINGHYLHDDMDYRNELKPLEGLVWEMHRAQFLEGVIVTLKYTNWLARNVAFLLERDLLDFSGK
jgi:hypothetical protein